MQSNYYIDDEEVKAKTQAAAERLTRIAHMMVPSDLRAAPADRNLGRNFFVRTVDALLAVLRKYALPLHWLVIAVGAIVLFAYIRLVAFTARLRTVGERQWPSVLAPSWHYGTGTRHHCWWHSPSAVRVHDR